MDINEIDALIFDFDGVLTDNKVYVSEDGIESVCCSRSDGLAFDALRKLKVPAFIISSESNPVVATRANKLKIDFLHGVTNKLDPLNNLCTEKDYKLSKILFVGNDINDYEVMKSCGYSACPSDSHNTITDVATFVLQTKGGCGVVREVLEVVFNLNLLKILY